MSKRSSDTTGKVIANHGKNYDRKDGYVGLPHSSRSSPPKHGRVLVHREAGQVWAVPSDGPGRTITIEPEPQPRPSRRSSTKPGDMSQ